MKPVKLIALISFLFALANSFLAYAQSDFVQRFISLKYLGLFFAVSYLIAFLVVNYFAALINRTGKFKVVVGVFLLNLASLLFLIYFKSPLILAFLLIYLITTFLVWILIDLYLEYFSRDQVTGEIRGAQLTTINLGIAIAPFLAGALLQKYGFSSLFTIVFFLTLITFLIFTKFKKIDHTERTIFKFQRLFPQIWNNKSLRHIFYLAFLLQFFYGWMVFYTPLYLLQNGFNWAEIGKIFTVMLVPFIILQYPAGWLADKYWGEKEMMTLGVLIMGLATLTIFFWLPATAAGWMLLLFLTRCGAAMVEIMRDSYFFKQIDATDIPLIDSFRNMIPLALTVAPLLASLIIALLPLQFLFLFLGLIILTGVYSAVRLRDTK